MLTVHSAITGGGGGDNKHIKCRAQETCISRDLNVYPVLEGFSVVVHVRKHAFVINYIIYSFHIVI